MQNPGYMQGIRRRESPAETPTPRKPSTKIDPDYYASKKIEPMDVIEDWELGHHLACVLKYIGRFGLKGDDQKDYVADLEKAKWYLERKIGIETNKIG